MRWVYYIQVEGGSEWTEWPGRETAAESESAAWEQAQSLVRVGCTIQSINIRTVGEVQ